MNIVFADSGNYCCHCVAEAGKPRTKWDPKPGEKEPKLVPFDGE